MEGSAMEKAILGSSSRMIVLCSWFVLPIIVVLVITGFGHVMTSVGRRATKIVLLKCFVFLRLCFGYWTDEDVEAFGIHKKVFDYSSVWAHPEVLLRIKDYGLQEKFDTLRRSESPTMSYKDIEELLPALKTLDLEEQYRDDYSAYIYGV